MSESPIAPPSLDASRVRLDSAILSQLMDVIPDRIYFKDLSSRFLRSNRAQARFLGLESPDQLLGKTDFDFFSKEHAERAFAAEQEIIRTGEPPIGRMERIVRREGSLSWGSTTKMPWHDAEGRIIGTFGLTRDMTTQKEAEDRLQAERNLLRTIINLLPSRIFVKDREGRYLINNRAHLRELGVASQAETSGRTIADFHSGDRTRQAVEDDRQVISGGPSILNSEKFNFEEGGAARWSLTTKVPLKDIQDAIVGLVGISLDITERKRTEQELRDRTTQMEDDLAMARQVQESFLPRIYPTFPAGAPEGASALRFAHRYIPAASLGGDFCDLLQLSDTRCGVLVCDVMGHGVRAGLLTALIRGVIREIAPDRMRPGHVLSEINRALMPVLTQLGQPLFATVFFGVINTTAGVLTMGNAGHPPPLIRRADGAVELLRLADPEPAAGLVDSFAFSERDVAFGAGDRFLAYTDGLFEVEDASGRQFGEERVRACAGRGGDLAVADWIDGLIEEARRFANRPEFGDDVCILAAERAPS